MHASVVPSLVARASSRRSRVTVILASIATGALLLSALAQLRITLPFTPVPITGQTLGVALLGLLWGRQLGLATFLTYLSAGALGLPVFAGGKSGLAAGPTLGYLVGMCVASFVVGTLADRGWTRSWWRAWLAASAGSCITFAFGALGLSYFVPASQVFALGVLPFLPGDVIKNSIAATAAVASRPNAKWGSRLGRLFVLALLLALPIAAAAQMQVAFLEMRNPQGQLVQLEPGGRFAHVAVSFQGQWLHAHPDRGVELASTEELERMGRIAIVLTLPDRPEFLAARVQELLGTPYDRQHRWENESCTDCAKMIGKELSLEPRPALFAAPIWPQAFRARRGEMGLSPDDIYQILIEHLAARSCEAVFG